MKKFLAILFLTFPLLAGAQQWSPASADDAAAVLAKVDAVVSNVGTLSCNFVQTKHTAMLEEDLVSKGRMSVEAPATLVWEYTSPSQKSYTTNLNDNRRYQAMARKKDFSREVFSGAKEWKIVLTPLKRDLKQLFAGIEVWMDKASGEFTRVVMTDPNGDTTKIEFSNVKR